MESLNCAFDYGELLNSQKQAIITYMQKKNEKKVLKSSYSENKLSESLNESLAYDLPEIPVSNYCM